MAFATFTALSQAASEAGSIAQAVVAQESREQDVTPESIYERLHETLAVMREAVARGLDPALRSRTGLTGGDSARIMANTAPDVAGPVFSRALALSVATVEVNAAMGRIVAAPTAGASGVVPGVLLALAEEHDLDDDQLVDALLTAAGIGSIYAATATLSGAAGGCQAEVGVGASMAAGAAVTLLGGSIEQVGHAASLAMQGQLGLVCDPVAGLVEIPCIMRNATGASVALAGAQMALAGVTFALPFDEVVRASARVGASLPPSLRETAKGGLAQTPTACRIAAQLAEKQHKTL